MFGPVAVVPERLIRFSKKSAVAPVLTFHQSNVGIRVDLIAGLSRDGRMSNAQDQARYGMRSHAPRRAVVIIVGTGS
jgi:hypothetical protein